MILAENDRGLLSFDSDELIITSKTEDAGKIRFHSPNGTMGAIAFCDQHGAERVLVVGNRTEGLKVLGNRTGVSQDGAMKPLMAVNWHGVDYRVPVIGQDAPVAGKIALRTHHGLYLCVEPDGRVVANREHAGPWETFTAVAV